MAKTNKTFKLEACTSKDRCKEFICGIYHAEGYKIATDGRCLAMIKAEYSEGNEGKIIEKDLFPIAGQFPNYKRVIPDREYLTEIPIDWEVLEREYKEYKKTVFSYLKKYSKKDWEFSGLHFSGRRISNNFTNIILDFVKCYPEAKLFYNAEKENSPFVFVQGDYKRHEAMLLVMPLYKDDWQDVSKIVGNWYFKVDDARNNADFAQGMILKCKLTDAQRRVEAGINTEKDSADLKALQSFIDFMLKD